MIWYLSIVNFFGPFEPLNPRKPSNGIDDVPVTNWNHNSIRKKEILELNSYLKEFQSISITHCFNGIPKPLNNDMWLIISTLKKFKHLNRWSILEIEKFLTFFFNTVTHLKVIQSSSWLNIEISAQKRMNSIFFDFESKYSVKRLTEYPKFWL